MIFIEDKVIRFDRLHLEIVHRKAEQYAKRNTSAEYRSKMRNVDPETAKRNDLESIIGEFHGAYLVYKLGYPVVMPDVSIRMGKDKGWYPDLATIGKPCIHTKTCTDHTRKFGRGAYEGDDSWLFNVANTRGGGGRDALFDLPNDAPDLIMLIHIAHAYAPYATVKAVVPWLILRNPKYHKPMTVPKYKDIKKAIFYTDLLADKDAILNLKAGE